MCTSCKKLLPLATTGDGNCLLHAASLGELQKETTKASINTVSVNLAQVNLTRNSCMLVFLILNKK